MYVWEKRGQVFEPGGQWGRAWMQEFAQSPAALVGEDRVRVFFCTRPGPDPNGKYVSFIAYLDLDRGNLLRVVGISPDPVLALGPRGAFDEFGTYPVSAVRDDDGSVRLYYGGVTRCESVPFTAAIGMAVSCDQGTTFTRLGDGPVLSLSPDEPFLLGSPRVRKFGGRWYLWYACGRAWRRNGDRLDPVYKIRMATSTDGIDWVKAGRDLLVDRLGEDECQACPDVLFRDRGYHMFFSYRRSRDYLSREHGYRIGYAFSPDLENWRRHDELAGIAVSETGWDSQMVSYPHVFMLDGETYMLYQGNGMGRTGFGLARLVSPERWTPL